MLIWFIANNRDKYIIQTFDFGKMNLGKNVGVTKMCWMDSEQYSTKPTNP